MERVCKGFTSHAKAFSSGELGDFSGVKNYKRLLSQRYLSTFTGEIFICPECPRQFDSARSLQAHLVVSHPDADIQHALKAKVSKSKAPKAEAPEGQGDTNV